MIPYQNKSTLCSKLRLSDQATQNLFVKKISYDFIKANRLDMQELLETVCNVTESNLQIKLFSLLSAYIISKGKYYDIILTCTRLYDTIHESLNNSVSQRTTTTLNFISALLYVDDDSDSSKRKNLTLYAQNMLRVSGCLTTMSVLFCNTMMYKDTWKSLCRALAESCKDCELNQLHCSHLIPVCVQKLHQKHVDSFLVLLSIVQNNDKNITIFLQANGISIFTREFLQMNSCLQVINSIVEQSLDAVRQIQHSGILTHLRDLLKAYGPSSQIGQWVTVIMFRIDVQLKKNNDRKATSENIIENLNNTLKIDEVFDKPTIEQDQEQNNDETALLLSNVFREIYRYQSQSQSQMRNVRLDPFQNVFKQNLSIPKNIAIPKQKQQQIPDPQVNHNFNTDNEYDVNDMSFSFLDKQIKQMNRIRLNTDNCATVKSMSASKNKSTLRKHTSTSKTSQQDMGTTYNQFSNFIQDISFVTDDLRPLTHTLDFQPKFMSTPKKSINRSKDIILTQKTNRDYDHHKIMRMERKKHKIKQNLSSVKQVKNRSMSARFFDVINESCTTVVKTFKTMFGQKQRTKDSLKGDSSSTSVVSTSKMSCSYSFTNYMRKRDALLSEGIKYESDKNSSSANTCKTCNDTLVLKNKLANDEHLKKTLKKLKLGINLYGCDFKKISKSLWPRERFMTPSVLYHLYRKLLVKH